MSAKDRAQQLRSVVGRRHRHALAVPRRIAATAVVVGLGLLAGVVAGAVVFSAEQPAPTFQAVAAG